MVIAAHLHRVHSYLRGVRSTAGVTLSPHRLCRTYTYPINRLGAHGDPPGGCGNYFDRSVWTPRTHWRTFIRDRNRYRLHNGCCCYGTNFCGAAIYGHHTGIALELFRTTPWTYRAFITRIKGAKVPYHPPAATRCRTNTRRRIKNCPGRSRIMGHESLIRVSLGISSPHAFRNS